MKKIFILLAAIFLLSGCSIFQSAEPPSDIMPIYNQPVACTMEAKLCPDGSAVGRSGPNCEFAPCPGLLP